jgi:ribulose-phosphate 3-epimerase
VRGAEEVVIEFSVLCLERSRIRDALHTLLPLVDSIHVDIMDGRFVPNHAFTPDFINALPADRPKHVHAVAYDPLSYLDALHGIDSFNFHVEAVEDCAGTIERIHAHGFRAGLCLNPETPASRALPYLSSLDRVVLMAVRPGFAGQSYLPETSAKLEEVRRSSADVEIVVDGGMDEATVREVRALGADACCLGSAIVKADDWAGKIAALRAAGRVTPRRTASVSFVRSA